jgi:hypothetical protein
MLEAWANEFAEIPGILTERADLREAVLVLINGQPMPGKVTEGGNRLSRFREILKALVGGEIGLAEACRRTELELPRLESIYGGNNRVFASGWVERLVRTQYSRFYNQAVMEQLLSEGAVSCFIPHSSDEDPGSKCSRFLAGSAHDLRRLYDRLINSYARGNWTNELKIPEHPHCTHVVTPG